MDDPRTGAARLPQLPCACATLRRASRAVTQLYDAALQPAGLRATQFTLLQVLAQIGESTQGNLGQILALDTSTLSRTLLLLEKHDWIRTAPGLDRRERRIKLAPKGRSKMDQATPHWDAVQQRLRAALGEPHWADLFSRLDRVAARAESPQ